MFCLWPIVKMTVVPDVGINELLEAGGIARQSE